MTDHELMQLSEVVGLALKQRGATLTTAESCTGGWVAKAITDIAGSSAWFERGFVTYSNEAKAQMIGVREATLEQHGAVSEPVVIEMAIGALKEARADYAISISGIAGPDGGSAPQPPFRIPSLPEHPRKVLLSMEKEMTGVYITGHPLDEVRDLLGSGFTTVAQVMEDADSESRGHNRGKTVTALEPCTDQPAKHMIRPASRSRPACRSGLLHAARGQGRCTWHPPIF